MIVSKTNVSPLATITATPASDIQDISVISDGDYSSVYTDTLSTSVKVKFEFATEQKIDYIAISSNASQKDSIQIRSTDTSQRVPLVSSDGLDLYSLDGFRLNALYVNSIEDDTLGINESRVMMYRPLIEDAREIEIEIFGTGQIAISEIAMGEEYEIPNNGEQSGYNRPWTVPNERVRSATGLDESPISLSYEARSLSCTLSIPNNIMDDFDEFYEFVQFATTNTFYVLEDDNKFHSYAGFNLNPNPTQAHPSTRKLGVSTLTFNAFAKSTEALF